MSEIKIEISKILTFSQEQIIENLVKQFEDDLTRIGIRVLSKSIPKLRKNIQNG